MGPKTYEYATLLATIDRRGATLVSFKATSTYLSLPNPIAIAAAVPISKLLPDEARFSFLPLFHRRTSVCDATRGTGYCLAVCTNVTFLAPTICCVAKERTVKPLGQSHGQEEQGVGRSTTRAQHCTRVAKTEYIRLSLSFPNEKERQEEKETGSLSDL